MEESRTKAIFKSRSNNKGERMKKTIKKYIVYSDEVVEKRIVK